MTLQISRDFKSILKGSISDVEFGNFSVITGPNGSGKSNLLEGLKDRAFHFSDLGEIPHESIRLFRLGELLAATEGPAQGLTFKEPWANLYNNVLQWTDQSGQQNFVPNQGDANRERWIEENVLNNKLLSLAALQRIKQESGKPLSQVTEAEFRKLVPVVAGVKDAFSTSFAEVFLSYRQRFTANRFAQWLSATKNEGSAITDEEFVGRFGPAPWDALNDLMRIVGLDYSFLAPPESETTLYQVQILHSSGIPIKLEDLSSGEKVLLFVALSLFASSNLDEAIELPRLLLLDEADASLHPSMVKSLLTVLEEVFVNQYAVRVLLTTHSPTTVALAPPESLFVMSRTSPRLHRTTVDEAMKFLTVGITTLSVRLDNRRQVFVESEYDQAVYQIVFGLVKDRIPSVRAAEFIASSAGSAGGGCDEVKRVVKSLNQSGNTSVRGIIDRDGRQSAPQNVFFLADRYSIENIVLDPLILGIFLLREQMITASDLGLTGAERHFELEESHAQSIADALASRLGFGANTTSIQYSGGFAVDIATEFLETRGHDLQDQIVATFPPLNKYYHNKTLLQTIASRAVLDVPDFVPISVLKLFEEVLAD